MYNGAVDKILVIDDEQDVLYSFRRIMASDSVEILGAKDPEQGLLLLSQEKPSIILLDLRIGRASGLDVLRKIRGLDLKLPVIMMTAYGGTSTIIEAMKLGAFDYLQKPFDMAHLKQVIASALKAARDMQQVVSYEPLLGSEDYDLGIIGKSPQMQRVFKLIGQVAASNAVALITGESGTGKELVARAIYHHSERSERPFLAINCAAIPENLLESELFGYEKGAFTGATSMRIGKFEQCNGGTIFLDEIGDMSLPTQAKILRVLQSGTFERVGGQQTIKIDVRFVAATNKPLEEAVARKEFREDLFYRLNVVRIEMPALRERKSDIPLLVNYFLKKIADQSSAKPKRISPEAMQLMQAHNWPGNVRELENSLQRAVVVSRGDVITEAAFTFGAQPVIEPTPETAGGQDPLAAFAKQLIARAKANNSIKLIPAAEKELIVQALQETAGNQVQAAKLLGITRATLRSRIAKFKIQQALSVS